MNTSFNDALRVIVKLSINVVPERQPVVHFVKYGD